MGGGRRWRPRSRSWVSEDVQSAFSAFSFPGGACSLQAGLSGGRPAIGHSGVGSAPVRPWRRRRSESAGFWGCAGGALGGSGAALQAFLAEPRIGLRGGREAGAQRAPFRPAPAGRPESCPQGGGPGVLRGGSPCQPSPSGRAVAAGGVLTLSPLPRMSRRLTGPGAPPLPRWLGEGAAAAEAPPLPAGGGRGLSQPA